MHKKMFHRAVFSYYPIWLLSPGLLTLPTPAPTSTIPTATALARHMRPVLGRKTVWYFYHTKSKAFGKILTLAGLPSAFKVWLYHVGELAKKWIICGWKRSSVTVLGKFYWGCQHRQETQCPFGWQEKSWRAISKDNKGVWLIVSAERWACIYQIQFFTMQQVPTPFQSFSFISWRQYPECHLPCPGSSGAVYSWNIIFTW